MAQQCTCIGCGYRGCCCEMHNNLCGSCRLTSERAGNPVDNYCDQTEENLNTILNKLKQQEKSPLRRYRIAIVKSQINLMDSEPCKFKPIIDLISNEV